MSVNCRRFHRWSDLTLTDLVFAYRKAKADCFFERALSLTREFADYEQDLARNLQSLLEHLRSGACGELLGKNLFGEMHLVAKKLDIDAQSQKRSAARKTHAYFSDKNRAFAHLSGDARVTAEFRLASRFPVGLHILSALWVNRVGHRFDACLGAHAYGTRLRRYGDDGAPNERAYHVRAIGSMAPYFLPYQRWREDGLTAMERALDAGEKVIAVTLDIRSYFHRIDPTFLADRRFHAAIGLGRDDELRPEASRSGLTPVEEEFTAHFVSFLVQWSQQTLATIQLAPAAPEADASRGVVGGLPICVTACRLMANVLLHEWDQRLIAGLLPVYYGRYVDDMFLVLRDPGDIRGPRELMEWISRALPKGTLEKTARRGDDRRIRLGPYQGDTELVLQDAKHRVFFLAGRAGRDLLNVIRRETVRLSSERRLMPDPEALTTSPAAQVLTAAGDPRESADTLRRAEGLSLRRMGWAIQLRSAETLAVDLPPEEWCGVRAEFYRFAVDHVLRPECLLDHMDYLPRLIGLAVSTRDWKDAITLFECARDALAAIQRASEQSRGGVKINGHVIEGDRENVWRDAFASLQQMAQEAVVRAWPWCSGAGGSRPAPPSNDAQALLELIGLDAVSALRDAKQVMESDLARAPLKEHRREYGCDDSLGTGAPGAIVACFGQDADVISEFLDVTRVRRLPEGAQSGSIEAVESLLPYLFPTRPFTPREIAELDPRCVDLGEEPGAPRSLRSIGAGRCEHSVGSGHGSL